MARLLHTLAPPSATWNSASLNTGGPAVTGTFILSWPNLQWLENNLSGMRLPSLGMPRTPLFLDGRKLSLPTPDSQYINHHSISTLPSSEPQAFYHPSSNFQATIHDPSTNQDLSQLDPQTLANILPSTLVLAEQIARLLVTIITYAIFLATITEDDTSVGATKRLLLTIHYLLVKNKH